MTETFTAVAVGNNVNIINQWGGKRYGVQVSGQIISTPIISGETFSVLTQVGKQKLLGIYSFHGGKIGGRYI